MLECSLCEKKKANTQFPVDVRLKSGRSSWCRECRKKYQREYKKRRSQEPGWRANCLKNARVNRIGWYGLTPQDYEEIMAKQNGVCAGCGRKPNSGRNLDIDHKHQKGDKRLEPWERLSMVRGLLCHLCNRVLGILRDNPETFKRLAEYLENPPAVSIILPKFERLTEYMKKYEVKGELK